MKTSVKNNRSLFSGALNKIIKVSVCAAVLALGNMAIGQTTRSWTGLTGDFILGSTNNWSPNTAIANSDTFQWDATAATGNLQVTNAATIGGDPGYTFIIAAAHTGSFTLVSSSANNQLSLYTNGITVASGAGPVSFGNGGPTLYLRIRLGNAGVANSVHALVNNSANPATIGSDVNWVVAGGGSRYVSFGGATGNWNVYSLLKGFNSGNNVGLIINTPGTIFYSPTNQSALPAGGYAGVTLTAGTLKIGNLLAADAFAAGLALNGGTLDVNGVSFTNSVLSGVATIDTTAVGGSPILTINNTAGQTFGGVIKNSQGTLSLVKMGSASLTLTNANTYSGNTTVNAGSFFVNGSIGSGSVNVASNAVLGGTGTIGGSVTLQPGAFATFSVTNTGSGNGTPLTISGSLVLNTNIVNIFVAGSTALGAGNYTLVNFSSSGSSGQFTNAVPLANFSGAGIAPGYGASIVTGASSATLVIAPLGAIDTWTTDLAGGSGNWSAGANWSSNPNIPSNAGDFVTLGVGSAGSTINLDTNVSVGGIVFTNSHSFTIANTGKTLTLDDLGTGAGLYINDGTANSIAAPISLNDKTTVNVTVSNLSLSISGVIGGTNILTKTGNGVLVLSGNNTYGAGAGKVGTILNGGITELGNANALSSGDVTNAGFSTLKFDSNMTYTNRLWLNPNTTLNFDDGGHVLNLNSNLVNWGSISFNGVGTSVISGTNTIRTLSTSSNGLVEIVSGSTILANGQLLLDGAGTVQVDSGASLVYTNASAFGAVATGQNFITNTLILKGTILYTNQNFVVARTGSGVMTISNGGFFLCNNFNVGQTTNGVDFATVNLNGGVLYVNNVTGNGSGFHYFNFNGGTLKAKAAGNFWPALSSVYVNVRNNPGTIDNGGLAITVGQALNHSLIDGDAEPDGGMIFAGTNTTTLGVYCSYDGPTVVSNGTLLVTSAGNISGVANVNGGSLLNNGGTVAGDVTVASAATAGGYGAFSGNSTWQTGSAGYLYVTNNGGANGAVLGVGGTATLNNNSLTINILGGTSLPIGTYTLISAGSVSGAFNTNAVTFTGAGLAAGTRGVVSTSGNTVVLNVVDISNTWITDGSGNWSIGANWSKNPTTPHLPGDVAVFGVGSAYNTVTLDTAVSVGGIVFTNLNSFKIANVGNAITFTNTGGTSSIVFSGGSSNQIATPVILNGTTTTVAGSSNAVLSVFGNVSGLGGLSVAGGDGTGTLILSGSNTYSGSTSVSGGTLVLGSTNAIGTNALTFGAGGLVLDSLIPNLTNANNNAQFWNATNITLLGSQSLSMGNGRVTLGVSSVINVNSNNFAVSGVITGAFSLAKMGPGVLILNGANTFTGGMTISNGIVAIGNDGALGTGTLNLGFGSGAGAGAMIQSVDSTAHTITNAVSANVSVPNSFVGTGNLTFSGVIATGNGGKSFFVSNSITTFSGRLTDGGAPTGPITKDGPGTLLLTASNAMIKPFQLNNGILALGSTNAIGSGALTINGGGLDSTVANLTNANNNAQIWNAGFSFAGSQNLNMGTGVVTLNTNITITVNNNTLAIGGAVTNSQFSLTKSGAGTLLLLGANIYSNTTVNAGTFEIAQATLNTGSMVTITNGAVLKLDFGTTNQVAQLFLNGVSQPNGVYGSSTPGGYISGSGFLQVTAGAVVVGPTLNPVSPSSISGSTFPVTLNLTGTGFTGASTVLLTNGVVSVSGTTTFVDATHVSVSFIPGTVASSWTATVLDTGSYSASQPFSVVVPASASVSTSALTSAGPGKLVLSGSGGVAGYSYEVLGTTNLNPPIVWTPLVTNVFDGTGHFFYTNTIVPTNAKLFLRVQQ